MLTFLLSNMGNTMMAEKEKNTPKNSLINKFCIASLNSKLDLKDKQNRNEISNFTCDCFFKKYNSGNSIKNSRIYCRDKASEKYNL
tara:strand:+ start:714 stop:971 length:258 start_codon:yes stop_codon:yes gene_type:complete